MTASTPGLVRGVDFVVMPTREFETAVAFYGTTLGLQRSVYQAFFADPDGNRLILHHRYTPRN